MPMRRAHAQPTQNSDDVDLDLKTSEAGKLVKSATREGPIGNCEKELLCKIQILLRKVIIRCHHRGSDSSNKLSSGRGKQEEWRLIAAAVWFGKARGGRLVATGDWRGQEKVGVAAQLVTYQARLSLKAILTLRGWAACQQQR